MLIQTVGFKLIQDSGIQMLEGGASLYHLRFSAALTSSCTRASTRLLKEGGGISPPHGFPKGGNYTLSGGGA